MSSKGSSGSSCDLKSYEASTFDVLRGIRSRKESIFEPVIYTEEHKAFKFKRLLVRSHEQKICEKFQHLREKKRKQLARLMSYYPGLPKSKHQPLKPILEQYSESSRISFRESDDRMDSSYFFSDLPAGDVKWSPAQNLSEDFMGILSPRTPARLFFENSEQSPNQSLECQDLVRDFVPLRTPIRSTFRTLEQHHEMSDSYELSPILEKLKISSSQPLEEANIPSAEEQVSPSICESARTPLGFGEIQSSPSVSESAHTPLVSRKMVGSVLRRSPLKRRFDNQLDTNVHFIKLGRVAKKVKNSFLHIETISLPAASGGTTDLTRASDRLLDRSDQTKARDSSAVVESTSEKKEPSSLFLLVPKFIKNSQKNLIIEFVHEFGGYWTNVQDTFDPRISHVIAEFDLLGKNLSDSIENLMAVGYKRYLVDLNWIKDSLAVGTVLDARDYEVASDLTRVARDQPRDLFGGFAFLCARPFPNFTQNQFEDILEYNGGAVARDPKELRKFKDEKRICIVGDFAYFSHRKVREILKRKLSKCIVVRFDWVFKCFYTYSVVPLSSYLYFETSVKEAKSIGIPLELLEGTTEDSL